MLLDVFLLQPYSNAMAIGEATLAMLRSTEPFPFEAFLTPLLNELAQLQTDLILFWMIIISLQLQLSIMQLLSAEHLPTQVHLAIATVLIHLYP